MKLWQIVTYHTIDNVKSGYYWSRKDADKLVNDPFFLAIANFGAKSEVIAVRVSFLTWLDAMFFGVVTLPLSKDGKPPC